MSVLIAHYVSLLDIDRKNDLVELDIENLILKIASANSNRSDYLWDVGSGANWMGYHLSTMFALHEHFLSLPHNFVPSFILIDQPSQVYFPRDIIHAPEEIKTAKNFQQQQRTLIKHEKYLNPLRIALQELKENFKSAQLNSPRINSGRKSKHSFSR